MNIFYLDDNAGQCAQMHVDRHVLKMIIEYAQLLSTAHHMAGSATDGMFKMTHKNHPCAIWTRETAGNYLWLWSLFVQLCDEYEWRWGRTHATGRLIQPLNEFPKGIRLDPKTPVPLCMPDDYKVEGDPVASYRNYYARGKVNLHKWTNREMPEWCHEAL